MNTVSLPISNSSRLLKINDLLRNSKSEIFLKNKEVAKTQNSISDLSQDFALYCSLIEKPLNLLFSIDQFLFEFSRKNYQQKKSEEFFQQLKERKKLSFFYGHLTHKQIVTIYNQIKQKKGLFSKNFFSQLERRLDVVIYRSGMAKTIAQARQLIKHKKILVNHNSVTIPSFLLNSGDCISVTPEIHQKVIQHLQQSVQNQYSLLYSNENFYSQLTSFFETPKGSKKVSTESVGSLSFSTKKEQKKKRSVSNSQLNSKLLCDLFINLLCTRIKTKSFYFLKNQENVSSVFFQKKEETKFLNRKNKSLVVLKWKFKSSSKNEMPHKKGKHFIPKFKTSHQDIFYATQGSKQKQPQFWSFSSVSKKFGIQQEGNFNKIKSELIHFFSNPKKIEKKQFNSLNNKQLNFYRKSFLFLLRSLNNSASFYHLIPLSINKFILKHFPQFQKNLTWTNRASRVIKPIHLEFSYNLLTIIYLYSPQRLHFPFSLDLDLIVRSLR